MLSNITKIATGILMFILFVTPRLSYADWSVGVSVGDPGYHHDDHHDGWRDHHDDWRAREESHSFFYYHDHPHYGYHIHYAPVGGYTIWVNGVMYYYYDGLYYIREGFDYVLVNPPMGAYVSVIPSDFQPMRINGRVYYVSDGIYYVLTPRGYKVVPQPVVYEQAQTVVVAQPQQVVVTTQAYSQDSFPVNIPNGNGSYTTVVIKKSGGGFVGPQGEFYAQFPTVSQLKAMYSK